ncbi:hypothetical protein QA273_02070 [Glaesserella parasuis]|nr:hypothetical protein [Glaesserella parasuis]
MQILKRFFCYCLILCFMTACTKTEYQNESAKTETIRAFLLPIINYTLSGICIVINLKAVIRIMLIIKHEKTLSLSACFNLKK